MTSTIWALPKGAVLPMHSHPGKVVTKVVLGGIKLVDGEGEEREHWAEDAELTSSNNSKSKAEISSAKKGKI